LNGIVLNYFIKKEYDYAIRICAYLAGQKDKTPVAVSRISQAMHLTRPFTTKIVYTLIKSHILKSVQGKNGGIYLEKDATTLSVFDILLGMGFNTTLNDCLIEGHVCPLSEKCKIHRFFAEQEKLLFDNFKNKMISELIF